MSSKKIGRDGLPAMQDAFVDRYLVHLNATKAAEEVGYKHPNTKGPALLKLPNVAAAIQKRMSERQRRTQITQDRVIEEYARIAFANTADFFEWDERQSRFVPKTDLSPDQLAALQEITSDTHLTRDANGQPRARMKMRVRLHDKVRALDALAKHLGMFIERHEHTGKDGGPIEHREVAEMSDDELIRRAREQANRIALLAGNGNGKPNGKRNGGPHSNGNG